MSGRHVTVMHVPQLRAALVAICGGVFVGMALAVVAALADEDDPPRPAVRDSQQMAGRVDVLVEQMWTASGVEPAPPASDGEFVRRVYLDLVGIIPRVSEVRAFVVDERPNKRALLVDRLLDSPRHATHMATILRNRILPLGVDPTHDREALGLQKWLRTRLAKNLRYDNLVGGLLLTSGGDELGPALYFRANDFAPEKLASSTAELFLGVKLHCAQCHDHPYADWTQHDFWGLAAFFARVRAPAERMMGGDSYRLVDADHGEVKIPESNETVAPKFPGGEVATEDEWQTRRVQFTTWMASRDNRLFTRATVNWAWTELFGQGLVDSLDHVEEVKTSDQVQLLDELADYFANSGFDLQELWRTLANTRAYQLSSRHKKPDSAPPELFARKLAKPLTPEQLHDSLMVLVPRDAVGEDLRRAASSFDEDPLRMEFVREMRPPPGSATEFRGGTLQALMLMNGRTMSDITAPENNRLLQALDAPFMDDDERVDAIFLAALSRQPDDQEHNTVVKLLNACETPRDRNQVLSDLLWALVNSTEFAFNR